MIEKGTKVIIRSNEDEPFRVGEFVGMTEVGQNPLPVPIVNVNGQKLLCFSIMIPYSTEMEHFLSTLSNQRQYKILRDLVLMRDTLSRVAWDKFCHDY